MPSTANTTWGRVDFQVIIEYNVGCSLHCGKHPALMMAGAYIMTIYGMSDRAVLREIGQRLKKQRLRRNLTQQNLADQAGVSRTTISDMEQGSPFQVLTLIQALRALRSLEAIEGFLPDPGISPLQLARMKGKERQRASS